MNLKKVEINYYTISIYKSRCKGLRHVRVGSDYKGFIYTNDNEVVGFTNMRLSDKYIQAIEVNKEYQSKGIGSKLLKDLIALGAVRLSVNKKNKIAIKMYEKHKFVVEDEDEKMLYMVLKK